MRISDWSSDVCSSDLHEQQDQHGRAAPELDQASNGEACAATGEVLQYPRGQGERHGPHHAVERDQRCYPEPFEYAGKNVETFHGRSRSEEHTSELQSLMRISYAVFCLKKKT